MNGFLLFRIALIHLFTQCNGRLFRKYYGGRIVGGYEVKQTEFPHQVLFNGCGGAIIDKRWIITAGHCERQADYKDVSVGGLHSDLSTTYEVAKRFQHPKYKLIDRVPHNDYLLLYLKEDIKFNPEVRPIKLGGFDDIKVGSMTIVTGYGKTGENISYYPKKLNAVKVPLVSWKKCRRSYKKLNITIPSRVLCAGYDAGLKDACKGDSGGPLHNNGKLIGITSFGLGCARPGIPGVYSNIPKVKQWIKNVTKIDIDIPKKKNKNLKHKIIRKRKNYLLRIPLNADTQLFKFNSSMLANNDTFNTNENIGNITDLLANKDKYDLTGRPVRYKQYSSEVSDISNQEEADNESSEVQTKLLAHTNHENEGVNYEMTKEPINIHEVDIMSEHDSKPEIREND